MSGTLERLAVSGNQDTTQKFDVSLSKASAQFKRELACLRPKIHAEIQLIYHYEINPHPDPPLVIYSSKNSCFLCDAFVKVHGKFFISRTHGVVYPQWALPSITHRRK